MTQIGCEVDKNQETNPGSEERGADGDLPNNSQIKHSHSKTYKNYAMCFKIHLRSSQTPLNFNKFQGLAVPLDPQLQFKLAALTRK